MKVICNAKKIWNSIQNRMKKTGSGTLVVVISSLIFVMYVSSTYADVRHLKYMQEQYEKKIIDIHSKNVDNVETEYTKVL